MEIKTNSKIRFKRAMMAIAFLILFIYAFPIHAGAAKNDFEIKDGVLIKYSGNSEEVEIPNTVTVIGLSAFSDNEKITSVKIPYSVIRIELYAFKGCTALS